MTRYAATTEVPIGKSRAEIEATVLRYGADGFMAGWDGDRAMVQFRCNGRSVRLLVEMPPRESPGATVKRGFAKHRLTSADVQRRWDQACRQRWRALALLVKAKLEAVDSGIVTFEQEFLPHILLPEGGTVYEYARGPLALAYETGATPRLLPGPGGAP